MSVLIFLLGVAVARAQSPGPQNLDEAAINNAAWVEGQSPNEALIIKAEVLLDRLRFSPGVIDGKDGDNLKKAITAFQTQNHLDATGKLDSPTIEKLAGLSQEPVITRYEIIEDDVRGPFLRQLPTGFERLAPLPRLSYTGPRQELAAKFHMSESLLTVLNESVDFHHSGARILVANPKRKPEQDHVTKIVVDKSGRSLSAFDNSGKLVAFDPASIGSTEKPAPTGIFKVLGVTRNPIYVYNPKFHFKGVKAKHKLIIKPGPNNPVGLVWIDLSAPSYGNHGTPAPDEIGKTASHGCIRLTTWDALDLAGMVSRGATVDFHD